MYLSRDHKLRGALPSHQWRIKEFSKEEVDSFTLIKSYRGLVKPLSITACSTIKLQK